MDSNTKAQILAEFERTRMEQFYEDARIRLTIATDTGLLWAKSMLIFNGGAIVAILALLGSDKVPALNPEGLRWAVGFFALSGVAVLLTLLLAFIGQDVAQSAETMTAENTWAEQTMRDDAPDPVPVWAVAALIGRFMFASAAVAMVAMVPAIVLAVFSISLQAS